MDGTQAELYPKTEVSRRRFGASDRAKGSSRMISHPQASMKTNNGRMDFMGCCDRGPVAVRMAAVRLLQLAAGLETRGPAFPPPRRSEMSDRRIENRFLV